MGDWHISIVGHGIHHNGLKEDADQLAKEFVAKLKEAGQEVISSTILAGGLTKIPEGSVELRTVTPGSEDVTPVIRVPNLTKP